jgi:site-specific DNA-methyltransferase (adenine-specific)
MPFEICSESYLLIGVFDNKESAENLRTYIKSNFFRYLVSTVLLTQNIAKDKFCFVPMQNFDEEWTDEKLYKKYGLESEEIAFIESMVRPMA